MTVYPQLPAEMPGVLLKCHIPIPGDNSPFDKPYEPDWFELADKAAHNADLDNAEQLPPPPDVFEIDDDDEYVYVPPHTTTSPFVKQEPLSTHSSTTPTATGQPPTTSARPSTRTRCPPSRFDDYHMFTTVAEERCQPPEHPYHTTGGTDVELAIQDEELMAHLCHFVMVHTAASLHLAQIGLPTKKQYGLKAGTF
jgi:hypothetical protein